jgi:thioredoxin 1
MTELTAENFEQEVVKSPRPVLVDFWGPQCGPCLALMPQVEALCEKFEGRVKIAKVEAPKSRRLCLNLKVMGLPTFLLFKEGKEVDRLTGNVTIRLIEDALKKVLGPED